MVAMVSHRCLSDWRYSSWPKLFYNAIDSFAVRSMHISFYILDENAINWIVRNIYLRSFVRQFYIIRHTIWLFWLLFIGTNTIPLNELCMQCCKETRESHLSFSRWLAWMDLISEPRVNFDLWSRVNCVSTMPLVEVLYSPSLISFHKGGNWVGNQTTVDTNWTHTIFWSLFVNKMLIVVSFSSKLLFLLHLHFLF